MLCAIVYCRLLGLKLVGGGYFTTRGAALCVVCYWAVAVIINSPLFAWADVYTRRLSAKCGMPNVDGKTLQVYTAVILIFTFFTPLVTTWISYCSIIYKTHKTWKMVITYLF